jgi:glycosyltransferase involved in cell wall biosynthesis
VARSAANQPRDGAVRIRGALKAVGPPVFHLEVGPLKESEYTGISQVTAAIAEEMLGDQTRRTAFFFGRVEVDRDVVEDLVTRRNGELIEWYLRRSGTRAVPREFGGVDVAIFPNRKTCRGGFDIECQIVHDLSTFLTPQFHNQDTIEFHTSSLYDDVHSNDLTFCVSESTRDDVLRYLGPLAPERVVVLPLAAAVAAEDMPQFAGRRAEPYVIVLGTIEPRKNVSTVLEYLASHRTILRRMRFVFLGRDGWGERFETLLARHDLQIEYEAGHIVFPGYVNEVAKNLLLRHARVLVYPSLFEGFGLPVLEALAFGVPVVTTRSSSLPEVGGSACYYFSPFVDSDFGFALSRALTDLTVREEDVRRRCLDRAAEFSWRRTYSALMAAVEKRLSAAGSN